MKKKIFDLGIPHYITIETEEGSCILKGTGETVQRQDVTVEITGGVNCRKVSITARDSKVRSVKLRWNSPLDKSSRLLGSSWERTFGDAQWKGISGRAFMPWYFCCRKGSMNSLREIWSLARSS